MSQTPADYSHLLNDLQAAASRTGMRLNPDQKLSLCMIARNEEAFIGGALESARDIVDEMIVVDTGSSDRTVEIAREYGAKVYFYEWRDNFADARNEALKHATGDWVLILDADERLPEDTKQNLRMLLIPTQGLHISYLIHIRNYMDENDKSNTLGHYMVRLFTRSANARFFGQVHEQVYPNGSEVVISESTFYLEHLGYQNRAFADKKQEDRNLPLIQKAVEENRGKNPQLYSFYCYYLGSFYTEDMVLAKKWYKESIESAGKSVLTHLPVTYAEALKAHYLSQDYDAGLELAQKGLDTVPTLASYPNFWHYYGSLLMAVRRLDEAIVAFRKIEELTVDDQLLFQNVRSKSVESWQLYVNLGLAHALRGDVQDAEKFISLALEKYEGNDRTALAVQINHALKDPSLTLSYFEQLVSQDSQSATARDITYLSNLYLNQEKPFEAMMLQHRFHGFEQALKNGLELASVYETHGRFDLAKKTYEGLLSLDPEHFESHLHLWLLTLLESQVQELPAADLEKIAEKCRSLDHHLILAEYALRLGATAFARDRLDLVLAEQPDNIQAQLHLAFLYEAEGDADQAEQVLEKLLKAAPDTLPAYTQLGNLLVAQGRYEEGEAIFERLLALDASDWYPWYALAVARWGQQHLPEASQALLQAQARSPQNPQVLALSELLTAAVP